MTSRNVPPLDYPTILQAVGHLVQDEHLSDICITEFDKGWIVHGIAYRTTAQGFVRVPVDREYTHEQIRQFVEEVRRQNAGNRR